jgi:hypothetical protein
MTNKLLRGLVVMAGSLLLLLPVSGNAFLVQHKDLADFTLSPVTTNVESSVLDFSNSSFGSTSSIVSSAGSTSGITSLGSLVEDLSTDPLSVSPIVDFQEVGLGNDTAGTGGLDTLLNVNDTTNLLGDGFGHNTGASLTIDTNPSSIKVSEPGSILLVGLGLIGLMSVVRISRGKNVINK